MQKAINIAFFNKLKTFFLSHCHDHLFNKPAKRARFYKSLFFTGGILGWMFFLRVEFQDKQYNGICFQLLKSQTCFSKTCCNYQQNFFKFNIFRITLRTICLQRSSNFSYSSILLTICLQRSSNFFPVTSLGTVLGYILNCCHELFTDKST